MKTLALTGWAAAVAAMLAVALLLVDRAGRTSPVLTPEALSALPELPPLSHLAGVRVVGVHVVLDGDAKGLNVDEIRGAIEPTLKGAGLEVAQGDARRPGVHGVLEVRIEAHPSGPPGTVSVWVNLLLYRPVVSEGDGVPVRAPAPVWSAGAAGAGPQEGVREGVLTVSRTLAGRFVKALGR